MRRCCLGKQLQRDMSVLHRAGHAPPPPQVVASLKRRVDEGHVQLAQLQQLAQQKQCLIDAGQAALAQHCRETWGPAPEDATAPGGGGAAGGGVEVAVVRAARSGLGQWRLTVELVVPAEAECSLRRVGWRVFRPPVDEPCMLARMQACSFVFAPCHLLRAHQPAVACACCRPAVLVASSPAHQISAERQEAWRLPSAPASAPPPQLPSGVRWQLSCTLSLQEQPGVPRNLRTAHLLVDVGVMLSSGGKEVQLLPLSGPRGGSFVAAGRVELPLSPLAHPPAPASSGGSSRSSLQQQDEQLGRGSAAATPGARAWRHRLDLVARAEGGAEVGCLHSALLQLGAQALPLAQGNTGSPPQSSYALPLAPVHGSSSTAAASVQAAVTWHSAHFAEVALQGDDAGLLHAAAAQLERGMQADVAHRARGRVALQPSMLHAQAAEQAVRAAGALLTETDACIEWVEALLRERLALASQYSHSKLPSDLGGVLARQQGALAAAEATDACLVGLWV